MPDNLIIVTSPYYFLAFKYLRMAKFYTWVILYAIHQFPLGF